MGPEPSPPGAGDVSADLPGVRGSPSLRLGPSRAGQVLLRLDTRQERPSGRRRPSATCGLNLDRAQRLVEGTRSDFDFNQSSSSRRTARGIRATHRPQADPGAVRRRAQIRSLGQYLNTVTGPSAPGRRPSHLRGLLGASTGRAALRLGPERARGGGRLRWGPRGASPGPLPTRGRAIIPAKFMHLDNPGPLVAGVLPGRRGRRAVVALPPPLRALRRLGLRRRDLKARRPEYRGVRQQFVKLGGTRGDQVAIVSGVNPGEEVVTSGVFKLRNGRRGPGQQRGAAGE